MDTKTVLSGHVSALRNALRLMLFCVFLLSGDGVEAQAKLSGSQLKQIDSEWDKIGAVLEAGQLTSDQAAAATTLTEAVKFPTLDKTYQSILKVVSRVSSRVARNVANREVTTKEVLNCGMVCARAAAWASASCYAAACVKCNVANPNEKPFCTFASARAYGVGQAKVCVAGCVRQNLQPGC